MIRPYQPALTQRAREPLLASGEPATRIRDADRERSGPRESAAIRLHAPQIDDPVVRDGRQMPRDLSDCRGRTRSEKAERDMQRAAGSTRRVPARPATTAHPAGESLGDAVGRQIERDEEPGRADVGQLGPVNHARRAAAARACAAPTSSSGRGRPRGRPATARYGSGARPRRRQTQKQTVPTGFSSRAAVRARRSR